MNPDHVWFTACALMSIYNGNQCWGQVQHCYAATVVNAKHTGQQSQYVTQSTQKDKVCRPQ